MTHLLGYFLVIGFLVLSHPAAAGPGPGQPGEFVIRAEAGMVTLKAQNISQRQILEGLAKQFNFELITAGPLDEPRSMEIDGKPWEEALKRALTPASWAFVYDSSGGQPRLAKVFVFPLKADTAAPGRVASGPGRVAELTPPPRPAAELPGSSAPQAVDPNAEASMGELLNAEDDETRALALVGLAATGGEQAIAALRQALQDREPWIRETAIEALAEIGGEQAMQGLQLALRDENEEVRKAAEEALRRLQPTPQ
jgi:hypothetical protein